MSRSRTARAALAVALGAVVAAGIALTSINATAAEISMFTPNDTFDYQIGGPRTKSGVKVVIRDREAPAAAGLYNICYVNAFQSQPDEAEIAWWRQHDLTLKDARGREVVDGGWNEILLDITTSAKRRAVADKVNEWIDGCKADGYQAIEPDNLDSYQRSKNLIDVDDAIAYVTLLADHAHANGMAIAQKNAGGSEQEGGVGARGADAGLDFAVVEECGRFTECDKYAAVYRDKILAVEYTSGGFRTACNTIGATVAVVRRDTAVSPSGPFETC